MKHNFKFWFSLVVLSSLMFQAYQCGSTEMTSAKLYISQKNYDAAIKNLETEVEKNPGNEEAWYLLGGLRVEKGDYAAMNFAFNKALKLSDKHAREIQGFRYNQWGAHLNNGVSLLDRASSDSSEYYEKAIAEFSRAIEAWPDTALSYRYLGYAYNNKGDYDNALKAFEEAWKKGKDVESLRRAGRIYLQRGYDHKSKFEGDNAGKLRGLKNLDDVKKGTNKNDVLKSLGAPDNVKKGTRASRREEWTYNTYSLKLVIEADKVAQKTFTSPYSASIDSTEHRLALIEFDRATKALEEVKVAEPSDNENLTFLLRAYVESGKIKEAITTYQQAVKNDPKNKNIRYLLGVLYRTDGDYTNAIAQFKEAVQIDPEYSDAIFDLGATYYNWGVDIIKEADEKGQEAEEYKSKFNESLPYMEKAAQLRKDDPQVWETLGTIYARLGNKDKAMRAFEQADKIRKGN
ncbi:MAG: tetratricopeptide repeat protein [Ignavibacteriales bacterium]|nr:tetratricopeptide repeat protein [Ignavibacteriales bacterium]